MWYPKRSFAKGGSQEVKRDILDHQSEKDHMATGCVLVVVREEEGLEVQKDPSSPKIKDIYLFQTMSSYVNFPCFLHFLLHIPKHGTSVTFIRSRHTTKRNNCTVSKVQSMKA